MIQTHEYYWTNFNEQSSYTVVPYRKTIKKRAGWSFMRAYQWWIRFFEGKEVFAWLELNFNWYNVCPISIQKRIRKGEMVEGIRKRTQSFKSSRKGRNARTIWPCVLSFVSFREIPIGITIIRLWWDSFKVIKEFMFFQGLFLLLKFLTL